MSVPLIAWDWRVFVAAGVAVTVALFRNSFAVLLHHTLVQVPGGQLSAEIGTDIRPVKKAFKIRRFFLCHFIHSKPIVSENSFDFLGRYSNRYDLPCTT